MESSTLQALAPTARWAEPVKIAMSRAGRYDDAGFTLLEVLLALTVLSLAALALGPRLVASAERGSVAQTLALLDSTLGGARAAALRGRTVVVTLDLDRRRLRSSVDNRWHGWPSNVDVNTETIRELGLRHRPTIAFLADGTSSGARIWVRSGTHERIRNVAWLTGAITHGE
jgi:general secretion pathway protein H